MRVLLLDDEPSAAPLHDALRARPRTELCRATAASGSPDALAGADRADVVVLGPTAAARADLGDVIAAFADRVPVVVVGERDQAAAAVAAMKAGAADYVALSALDLAERVAAAAQQPERAGRGERAGRRRRADRREPGDRARARARSHRGPDRGVRAHRGRDGYRQGGRRARRARPRPAGARAVHSRQLRRGPGIARRERVLRACARCVHRSARLATRCTPTRRWWDALPRRDRGPAAAAPGEAPARGAGRRGPSARRQHGEAGRRAPRRRLESRALAHGRERRLPARSLLPPPGAHHPAPAAARARERPAAAGRAFRRRVQSTSRHPLRRSADVRSSVPSSITRGPATSASWRTRSSRCSSWPPPTATTSPPWCAARRRSTAASGPTSAPASCAC